MAQSLDDLREAHPDLGFALYAIEPRGVVTLEVYDSGAVYSFKGATADDAIEEAFPSPDEPELPHADMPTDIDRTPAPFWSNTNVFD